MSLHFTGQLNKYYLSFFSFLFTGLTSFNEMTEINIGSFEFVMTNIYLQIIKRWKIITLGNKRVVEYPEYLLDTSLIYHFLNIGNVRQ